VIRLAAGTGQGVVYLGPALPQRKVAGPYKLETGSACCKLCGASIHLASGGLDRRRVVLLAETSVRRPLLGVGDCTGQIHAM